MAAAASARGPPGLPSDWEPLVRSLVQSLEEARHFRGSLVIVHGPPGVGKTPLIEGALTEASVPNRRIRQTYLEPEDAESPFKAVLSLARWAAKLEELAPAVDSGSLVLTPFLRDLGVAPGPGARSDPHGPGPSGTDRSTGREYERLVADLEFYKRGVEAWGERSRFIHEVGWMILDAAARRHILWIVESAQYLDPHSLTVIRYLSACLEENPLLIWLNVDSGPDGELPGPITALASGPRSLVIRVPRLTRDGVREVLGWKHPGQAFSDRIVDSVFEESHGLLLSVEQLSSAPDVVRSSSPDGSVEGTGVLELGLRKVEELSPSARDLLERLAVVGEGASFALALRLAHREEAEVRGDLASLVAAGLLHPEGQDGYSFCLAALSGEVESHLAEARSRELHRDVAEAVEASGPGIEDRIFDLAAHWRKAESWEKATHACLNASRFSSDTFAPEGGLLYADRALEAARRLGQRPSGLEAEALVEKGRALGDLGRLHDSVAALREALELIGSSEGSWPMRARALFYLGRTLSSLQQPEQAFAFVEEASRALERADDARSRLMLHQVIGVAFMVSNQFSDAIKHFRAMLALAEGLGDPREVSYAQKNLSATLLALDPHDKEGWRLVNEAIEQHSRTNNFAGLAAGYLNRSETELQLQEVSAALADLDRSRQAAELAHAPLLITTATLGEAAVLLDRSEVERADGLLRQLAPWMPAMEQPWARVSYSLLLGRVAEARQRSDEADRLYEEAACLAEPGGEAPALWECRLRRAALARRVGATERFRQLRASLPSLEDVRRSAPALLGLREALEGRSATTS